MTARTYNLLKDGKAIFLAYDQGLEHGPTDFNLKNIDPEYIIDIAEKGEYNGVILQHGVAEKYYSAHNNNVPLIVKLNGTTALRREAISTQVCSVKRAIDLGASGVGYTVFLGSPHEHLMFQEAGKIVGQAHKHGLAVVVWVYLDHRNVDAMSTANMAYAARVGLELGGDIIKIKYNNDLEGFKWAVKAAGMAKIMVAGGFKKDEKELLYTAHDLMKAGASGMAIGRNIWQSKEPLKVTRALKEIIFNNKRPEQAAKLLD